MRRLYEASIETHFAYNSQMLFLVGPRQVGKTTLAKQYQKKYPESIYLNWDVVADRMKILSGQNFIEKILPLEVLRKQKPLVIFDEIHKFKDWKNYLKGFYDLYSETYHILVTGSARLDVFQSGGDSLMGRYFQLRIHPLSVRELDSQPLKTSLLQDPQKPAASLVNKLYTFGGFPAPFLKGAETFSKKWHSLRAKQLFYEDIRNLSHIHEIGQLEVLAELLKLQTGQLLKRSSLAKKIQVTVQTVSRWIEVLDRFYFCFQLPPWSKNISRSLLKEPKLYLWDWSQIDDPGARFENFVACHLHKAVDFWNDTGLGSFSLYFLRDKDKKEVDFLISKDQKAWILIEAKTSDKTLSKHLRYFQDQTRAPHAFQVLKTLEYLSKNCFDFKTPLVVPAQTFLSQLV